MLFFNLFKKRQDAFIWGSGQHLGGLMWKLELDLTILMGQFQLGIFYDSVIGNNSTGALIGRLMLFIIMCMAVHLLNLFSS